MLPRGVDDAAKRAGLPLRGRQLGQHRRPAVLEQAAVLREGMRQNSDDRLARTLGLW